MVVLSVVCDDESLGICEIAFVFVGGVVCIDGDVDCVLIVGIVLCVVVLEVLLYVVSMLVWVVVKCLCR